MFSVEEVIARRERAIAMKRLRVGNPPRGSGVPAPAAGELGIAAAVAVATVEAGPQAVGEARAEAATIEVVAGPIMPPLPEREPATKAAAGEDAFEAPSPQVPKVPDLNLREEPEAPLADQGGEPMLEEGEVGHAGPVILVSDEAPSPIPRKTGNPRLALRVKREKGSLPPAAVEGTKVLAPPPSGTLSGVETRAGKKKAVASKERPTGAGARPPPPTRRGEGGSSGKRKRMADVAPSPRTREERTDRPSGQGRTPAALSRAVLSKKDVERFSGMTVPEPEIPSDATRRMMQERAKELANEAAAQREVIPPEGPAGEAAEMEPSSSLFRPSGPAPRSAVASLFATDSGLPPPLLPSAENIRPGEGAEGSNPGDLAERVCFVEIGHGKLWAYCFEQAKKSDAAALKAAEMEREIAQLRSEVMVMNRSTFDWRKEQQGVISRVRSLGDEATRGKDQLEDLTQEMVRGFDNVDRRIQDLSARPPAPPPTAGPSRVVPRSGEAPTEGGRRETEMPDDPGAEVVSIRRRDLNRLFNDGFDHGLVEAARFGHLRSSAMSDRRVVNPSSRRYDDLRYWMTAPKDVQARHRESVWGPSPPAGGRQ